MKKTIANRLIIVIMLCMVPIAVISGYFQMKSARDTAEANAVLRIGQIKQILDNNNEEINKLKENLKTDYFMRSKAAAYMIQNNPEIIGDQEELKKIADLLQVDEIHLFNKEGTLYAGTEPKYFNYTFDSGEQMRFFRPMLEDYNLQLCQDIQPNTAEHKLMQYAAVWREDREGIVQIGMEPLRLIEAMKKNELPHIFAMVTADKDNTLFAADAATGDILGSNNRSMTGKNIETFGIERKMKGKEADSQVWNITIDGQRNQCVVEDDGDVLIGVSVPYQIIYQNVPVTMLFTVLGLIILAIAVVILIVKMLDHYIIKGLHQINHDLDTIKAGDLDYRLDVTNLPEFGELSSNINQMVASLLENTVKLSLIFQNVNIPIAVYEYNQDMKRVLATSKIGKILGIPETEMNLILEEQNLFKEKIKEICKDACQQGEDIYVISSQESRYVRIRSYYENGKTLGILVDVTEEVEEKQQIRYERDIDLLTGLYTRRAFFHGMEQLIEHPQELKIRAILMIDVDNLKQMNDKWGHEYGDKLLEHVAKVLANCRAPKALTARLSGDEFVMFLYNMESEAVLQEYIASMYQDMTDTVMMLPDDTTAPVRFSCGYTVFEGMNTDYRQALRMADQTMYKAKKSHKGEFVKYCSEDD